MENTLPSHFEAKAGDDEVVTAVKRFMKGARYVSFFSGVREGADERVGSILMLGRCFRSGLCLVWRRGRGSDIRLVRCRCDFSCIIEESTDKARLLESIEARRTSKPYEHFCTTVWLVCT